MEIRTNAELARENLTLRHKYKMLKIKYDMVNGALKKLTLLSMKPTADVLNVKDTPTKGKNNGHQ